MSKRVIAGFLLVTLACLLVTPSTTIEVDAQKKNASKSAPKVWKKSSSAGFAISGAVTFVAPLPDEGSKKRVAILDSKSGLTGFDEKGKRLWKTSLEKVVKMATRVPGTKKILGVKSDNRSLVAFAPNGKVSAEVSLKADVRALFPVGSDIVALCVDGDNASMHHLKLGDKITTEATKEIGSLKGLTDLAVVRVGNELRVLLYADKSVAWYLCKADTLTSTLLKTFKNVDDDAICAHFDASIVIQRADKKLNIHYIENDKASLLVEDDKSKGGKLLFSNDALGLVYEDSGKIYSASLFGSTVKELEANDFHSSISSINTFFKCVSQIMTFGKTILVRLGFGAKSKVEAFQAKDLKELAEGAGEGNATGLSSKDLPIFFADPSGSVILHYSGGDKLFAIDTTRNKRWLITVVKGKALVKFIANGVRLAPWFSPATPDILVARQVRKSYSPYRVISLLDGKEQVEERKGKFYEKFKVYMKSANFLTFLGKDEILMRSGFVYNWRELKKKRLEKKRRIIGFMDADHTAGEIFVSADKKSVLRVAPKIIDGLFDLRVIDLIGGKIKKEKSTKILGTKGINAKSNYYVIPTSAAGDLSKVMLFDKVEGSAEVINASTGASIWKSATKVDSTCAPMISPNGEMAYVVHEDGSLVEYKLSNGKKLRTLDTEGQTVLNLSIAKDGTIFGGTSSAAMRWSKP